MTESNADIMLAAQCRAARALLGFDQVRLAELARVSRNTVASFEGGVRTPRRASVYAMQRALEDAGVVFLPKNGGGAGVRFRFEWARAHERDDGTWAVLVRWKEDDPLELTSIENALKAADEAERRGDSERAATLRGAALRALQLEDGFLQEAIRRYDRTRRAIDTRRAEGPLSPGEAELMASEETYLESVASEIADLREARIR